MDAQKPSADTLNGQMALMLAMLNKLRPTPTNTTPTHPAPQEPIVTEEPELPDWIQLWQQERREQEKPEQDRRDKGKQPAGAPPNSGNNGGWNQGPPRLPPRRSNPNPSDDGSDKGYRGGERQDPLWRLKRANPVTCKWQ